MLARSLAAVVAAAAVLTVGAAPADAGTHRHYRILANRHTADLPDAHPCKVNVGSRGDATTCLTVGPWHRVGQPLADVLAEGGGRNADSRLWERRCFAHRNGPETLVACVGGYVENL